MALYFFSSFVQLFAMPTDTCLNLKEWQTTMSKCTEELSVSFIKVARQTKCEHWNNEYKLELTLK